MLIDFHTHVLPPAFRDQREEYIRRDATFACLFSNPSAKIATAEDLIRAMDEAHVDISVIMGFGWTDLQTAVEANDYILQSIRKYPGRLVGFCSVNPCWGNDAILEVERCSSAGASGIGELHPDSQGLDISEHCTVAPIMEIAQKLALVVVVHASEPVGHCYHGKGKTTPDKVYAFARHFPHNRIVAAHWGGGLPFYSMRPEVAETLRNVYFDTAASPLLYKSQVYSASVAMGCSQRIVFGTDFPLVGYHRSLQQVNDGSLDTLTRDRILALNARQLLGI